MCAGLERKRGSDFGKSSAVRSWGKRADVIILPIELLRPKIRVRRDLGDLSTLVNSIKKRGILQPLVVSESGDGRYEIVLGHRRYLAALEAGVKGVACDPHRQDELNRSSRPHLGGRGV